MCTRTYYYCWKGVAMRMWRLAATFVVISGNLLGTFSTPDSDLFREELDKELFSTVLAKSRLSVCPALVTHETARGARLRFSPCGRGRRRRLGVR